MTTASAAYLLEQLHSSTTDQDLQAAEELLAELEPQSVDPVEEAEYEEDDSDADAGFAHGNAALERRNRQTAASQEIGPLPSVKDPARRARCKESLREYAWTYFQKLCYKGFAPYQEEMLVAFEQVFKFGGNKCRAVRRGGLKSTLVRIGALWSVTNGYCRFPVPVGATDDKSNEHRDNILQMIATSPTLLEDYPELFPLVLKIQNPKKQLRLDGEPLKVMAKDERGCIVFPNIRGTECFCARIAPYSIMATDVSGLSFVDDDGFTVRPDKLIYDDVQTPQSAKSFAMTGARENAIDTTFTGLAGQGGTMSAVMVCTRREEDDLTSRYCDRERHPDWDGKSFPVLIKEPTNKNLWNEYDKLLRSGATPEQGFAAAQAFYVTHQEEMDEGGEVAWETDKEDHYVSALQWAMTMKLIKPDYFRMELQQQGAAKPSGIEQLSDVKIRKRLSHVPRGIVPAKATYLTAAIDSSDHVLWWMVCAWTKGFDGWIVDRGTWPDQGRNQFYKSDLSFQLEEMLEGRSWEEAFVHAHNCLDEILLRDWQREDGPEKTLDLLLKDWSDGDHKKRIESQVMASKNRSRIRPSKGAAPKPGKKPVHKWGEHDDDRNNGSHWVEHRNDTPNHVKFDANIWKRHAARRLQTTLGAPSAVSLYGSDEDDHRMLSEHFTSELARPLTYDGSSGIVYELTPGRDNDWWDTYIMNCVAASMLGCSLPDEIVVDNQAAPPPLPLPPGFIRGGSW